VRSFKRSRTFEVVGGLVERADERFRLLAGET
jgi:hypothetical protein